MRFVKKGIKKLPGFYTRQQTLFSCIAFQLGTMVAQIQNHKQYKENANHGITDQDRLYRLTIHSGGPVAVLGNGGVQYAVPVAGNGAFSLGIAEK